LREFIEPRAKLLREGSLVEFPEREISEKTDIFGHVAQRFSAYQKSGSLHGAPFSYEGVSIRSNLERLQDTVAGLGRRAGRPGDP
jgi:hypothetical protein